MPSDKVIPPPRVSIVVATYARLDSLKRCVEQVRENVGPPFELIVVGGASNDQTAEWAASQQDIVFIREHRRDGATRAYNKGFRAATAPYVMWLNDDAHPLPGAVEAAINMLERPDLTDVGMVAFYHNEKRAWNRLDEIQVGGQAYAIYNVRGRPYANFGLLRTALLVQLSYLDERYYFCAWDPDLSLKVQDAGLKVVGCRKALIHHEELIDERKQEDLSVAETDNARLFAKWNLPQKFSYPDPAVPYREMATALRL
jgi:GT2 family glycosyltransferase